MSPGVYIVEEDGGLVEMSEQAYDSEAVLQELLERYPSLLAGDQLGLGEPRRWALVAREVGLASEADGGERWSVDHLFLDQDGIPTLVEVKRSSDTRIRRAVVGQMLDYAANAIAYWPVDSIRAWFEATCERRDDDPDEILAALIEAADAEEFWQRVHTNLQAGRIRMVFVADEIPSELQRIVEFLNLQMNPAEVFAIEIKQYLGQGKRTLVPRVVGQTAAAVQRKTVGTPASAWDEDSFFVALERARGADEVRVAHEILDWARPRFTRLVWGRGRTYGSSTPTLDHTGSAYYPITIWTYGRIEINFQYLQDKPPFDWPDKRVELLRKLNEISGIDLPEDAIGRRPPIQLAALVPSSALAKFLAVMAWVLDEIRSPRAR